MGRVSFVSLVAVAALAMASAPKANAEEQLAANCEPPRSSASGGFAAVGQSFTSQHTGPLVRAEVDVAKSEDAGDYVVEIRTVDGSGQPTDTVLSTATVPDSSVPIARSQPLRGPLGRVPWR